MHSNILNPMTLKQLEELTTKDSPNFLNEIFELFLETAQPTLIELEKVFVQSDTDKVRRQAHRLKGIAFNLGAEKVVSLCQTLEDAGKKADLSGMVQILTETKTELEAVVRFLKQRMNPDLQK